MCVSITCWQIYLHTVTYNLCAISRSHKLIIIILDRLVFNDTKSDSFFIVNSSYCLNYAITCFNEPNKKMDCYLFMNIKFILAVLYNCKAVNNFEYLFI